MKTVLGGWMRLLTFCAALILSSPVYTWNAAEKAAVLGQLQAQQIGPDEYVLRRDRILTDLPDGILLLHARSAPKTMEQWGFIQDPSFLYFTGLSDLPAAILALDGPRRESRLFVPPPPNSFGFQVQDLVPVPGMEAANRISVDAVVPWDEFTEWVEGRLAEGVETLYVDEPRRPEATGVPDGLSAVAGPLALWRAALEERFPDVRIASAKAAIQALRWVKSPSEVAVLRRNAHMTASALLAVAQRIRPGLTQRKAEATVVAGCIESGALGPSFWPWIMSGPNARVGRLISAFFRYEQLNRAMEDGELVRVDIGCGSGLYGGDVGRTLPVSGRFSPGQREAWDLLVGGYLAGLEVMLAGVPLDVVRDKSVAAIEEARNGLRTSLGRQAAAAIVAQGRAVWHIHGVGVESGEAAGSRLEAGSVLAFEPMVEVGPDAFYLEDMILITSDGYEILSAGLPYTAQEIEAVMAGQRDRDTGGR